MIPTRFKNTTGNGAIDTLIDLVATTESIWYWIVGKPGEAFEAAMDGEATKGAWADLTKLLKAIFSIAFCLIGTGIVVVAGYGIGSVFSGMGVYAPPPPGVTV